MNCCRVGGRPMEDRAGTPSLHEYPAHQTGQRRLTRRRALQLGAAAGIAAGTAPLVGVQRAFASWNASLPTSLQGTISFQAYLYESSSGSNVTGGSQPNRLYGLYQKAHPGVQ